MTAAAVRDDVVVLSTDERAELEALRAEKAEWLADREELADLRAWAQIVTAGPPSEELDDLRAWAQIIKAGPPPRR